MSEHDLVIRGGTAIDGTGAKEQRADVAVKEGMIAAVGKVAGTATREIDADGALVTPGFVDIHTHYDGQSTWSSRLNPSSHQGVTTVVMGNCGVGFSPVKPEHHDMLVELMEGVEDIPGAALHEGLPWAWESFPEYLDFLSERQFDMDLGAQLPHAALRVFVMGERGANREEATDEDIAQMRKLTAEAIRAGAIGFSSSRTLNHRSVNGDPTPSLTAAEKELVGIGQGLADAGRGVIEMISDFKGLDGEFETLMKMVDAAGAPMTISLAQGLNKDGWRKILGKIDDANAQGRRVKGQVAPRAIGILFGLSSSRNPFSENSVYKEIADLPLAERVQRMRNDGFREKLLREAIARNDGRDVSPFKRLFAISDAWDYEPTPDQAIEAQAKQRGMAPETLAYELLLQNEGRQLLYSPFANYTEDCLDCCREMILHPNTVMGLGDGGAHVGLICDASFITYLLTHWGRDRTRGEKIDLPTLVKAQSHDTARTVGLTDRGVIKPGLRADLNVIDFDNLKLDMPHIVNDLPKGGGRFEQKTSGFLATIVNGQPTYMSGEATDALPGRLLRGAT